MQAIAAIHGFDACVGACGQCGLLLGPLGFKGRAFGQAPGIDPPARGFRVVGIRRLGGCFISAKLSHCHDEPRACERRGELCLGKARTGDAVARFKIRNNTFGLVQCLGQRRGGIGLGMREDNAAICVVPLPLEGRNRDIGGMGTAREMPPPSGPGRTSPVRFLFPDQGFRLFGELPPGKSRRVRPQMIQAGSNSGWTAYRASPETLPGPFLEGEGSDGSILSESEGAGEV